MYFTYTFILGVIDTAGPLTLLHDMSCVIEAITELHDTQLPSSGHNSADLKRAEGRTRARARAHARSRPSPSVSVSVSVDHRLLLEELSLLKHALTLSRLGLSMATTVNSSSSELSLQLRARLEGLDGLEGARSQRIVTANTTAITTADTTSKPNTDTRPAMLPLSAAYPKHLATAVEGAPHPQGADDPLAYPYPHPIPHPRLHRLVASLPERGGGGGFVPVRSSLEVAGSAVSAIVTPGGYPQAVAYHEGYISVGTDSEVVTVRCVRGGGGHCEVRTRRRWSL